MHCLPMDSLHKGSVMRGYDVFLVVSQDKLLNKQVLELIQMQSPGYHMFGTLEITIVADFTVVRDEGIRNFRFNFLLYWTLSIFLGYECASMFHIFVRKYRKYTINRWRVLNAV